MTADRQGRRLGRRIAANSGWQIAGLLAGSAISLATLVVVTRGLGPAGFGHLAAAIALLAIPVVLADSGLSLLVLREMSQDPSSTQSLVAVSMPLRLAVSACAVALGVGAAYVIPLDGDTRRAVLIGSIGAFLTLIGLAFSTVLQAQLRILWAVVGNVAGRVATLGLAAVAVAADGDVGDVMWAYVVGSAVTTAVIAVAVSRLVSLRPAVDIRRWKRMLIDSVPLAAAQGFGQLYYRMDTVLLAALRSPREVGAYAQAFKYVELTQVVASSVATSAFPPLARFAAEGDPRFRPLMQRVFDALLALSVPLSVLAAARAEDIVVAVGGEAFADAAVALQILAAYPIASFLNALIERAILIAGRDTLLAAWSAGFLVMNVAVNLALIPVFGFPAAAAAALGTEVAGLVVGALIFRRLLGFLPRPDGVLPVAAGAAAMGAILAFAPGPAALVAAASVLLYAAVALAVPGSIRALAADFLHGGRRVQAAS